MACRPLFHFIAATHLSFIKVMRTNRLTLRPLQHDDAGRIALLGGDWDVASMTGRIPYPYSAEAAQHWLTGVAHGEVVLGIWHANELIGLCGYSPQSDGSAELGYWIGKPYAAIYQHAARLIGNPKRILCIGDSAEHDVAGGRNAGFSTLLVLTGVSQGHDPAMLDPEPDYWMDSFTW